MMFLLVSELATPGMPVALIWGTLGFSRQAYQAWCATPVSDHPDADLVARDDDEAKGSIA